MANLRDNRVTRASTDFGLSRLSCPFVAKAGILSYYGYYLPIKRLLSLLFLDQAEAEFPFRKTPMVICAARTYLG
ncbi:MAG: hypothetical protein KAJ57_11540, partial [Woeseiaceae bacterium]|nr:hypothetical protein [Woeseiaceae bacterium]